MLGDQLNGLGPFDWLGKVLPEAKFKICKIRLVLFNFLDLSDRYRDICKKEKKKGDWGPVEWVGYHVQCSVYCVLWERLSELRVSIKGK